MGLSIICFKGSQKGFPNKYVLQSLNIAFIIENSADPDEMQRCQTTLLGVSSIQRVNSPLSEEFKKVICLGLFRRGKQFSPCLGLYRENKKKYSCPKPLALILCLKHHLVNLYQVCSNYASGSQKWPAADDTCFYLLRFYFLLILST